MARHARTLSPRQLAAPTLLHPKMRVPLAGGGQETLLSEVGAQYLLPLFSTRDACGWCAASRELLAAVTEQPWGGQGQEVKMIGRQFYL